MPIDEEIDELIKEDNPTSKAVSSLVEVKDRIKGKLSTDTETKTDLTDVQLRVDTAGAIISHVLEMSSKDFQERCILGILVDSFERKSISKNRLSRQEIVNVARQPDQQNIIPDNSGMLSNFFRPQRR